MRFATIHVFGGTRSNLMHRGGGVETFLKKVAEQSEKNNILFLAISKNKQILPEIITIEDIFKGKSSVSKTKKQKTSLPFFGYLVSNLFFSLITFLLMILLINRIQKGFKIFVHLHDPIIGAPLFLLLNKCHTSVSFISHFNSEYTYRLKTMLTKSWLTSLTLRIYPFFEQLYILKSDRVVVKSTSTRKYVLHLGCEPNKITQISNFIDLNRWCRNSAKKNMLRKSYNIGKNDFVLIYVGRLTREKNLETLITAFKSINNSLRKKMKLLIAGGLEKSNKNLHFYNYDNENVLYLGHRNDIPNLLQLSDVFVLPSFTEGFPNSLLEAMACGKAIIASNISSIQEIVNHGDEAILIDPHNPEELKQAILLLYHNPNLRAILGLRVREKSKLYDIDRGFEKILQMYEET